MIYLYLQKTIRKKKLTKIAFYFLWFIIALFSILSLNAHSEIYKYKDTNGKWHFSDQPPTSTSAEKVEIDTVTPPKKIKPRVYINKNGNQYRFIATNPYFIPVQMEIESKALAGQPNIILIPPNKKHVLHVKKNIRKRPTLKYRYVMGSPVTEVKNYNYQPPVPEGQRFNISQAFGGQFSHTSKNNYYAVDISMPVGTTIRAAREGIVASVKDDYHMGGTMDKQFFLDKANYITIVHEDDTFATYAHILMDSALVKSGDIVKKGQALAQSGYSGFSSGPHLHFVIRKNIGMQLESVKFHFLDKNRLAFTPKNNQYLEGY